MKLKNIFLLGGLLAGMALQTSCDDQLSALPKQSKVDGNVVVDQSSAISIVNGAYYRFAMCGTDNYDVESTGCANYYEIFPACIAGVMTYYQGAYMFETHGNSYYSSYSRYIWSPFYEAMAAANSAIDQITAANDSWFQANRKEELIAEAKGLRGIINFNILRRFGYSWDINSPYGNILRMEASSSKNLACPRSSVKETYEAILSDLDEAIAKAPEENENYYVNRWVAKGYKVRVLMQRGAEGDYAAAAELAKDIIDNSPYELEENVTDIFYKKGLDSQEVMFGIKPQSTNGQQTAVMEAYNYMGTYQWFSTDNYNALFDGDPRYGTVIGEVTKSSLIYDFDDAGNYVGYHWGYSTAPNLFKHFTADNVVANEVEESMYMLRLTEIYLLRAEALARTGNLAEAKTLLKTVMGHAGITDFTAVDDATDETSFLQQYFNEFLRNLSCENGAEADLMLRMPQEIVYAFNPEYFTDEDGVIKQNFGASVFAIPGDEFKNNTALSDSDQNPGYSTTD